jgi:hypothetical protein
MSDPKDPREIADGIMARCFGVDWSSPANGRVVAERRRYLRDAILAALTTYGDARWREGVEAAAKIVKAEDQSELGALTPIGEHAQRQTMRVLAAIRALADTQEKSNG